MMIGTLNNTNIFAEATYDIHSKKTKTCLGVATEKCYGKEYTTLTKRKNSTASQEQLHFVQRYIEASMTVRCQLL